MFADRRKYVRIPALLVGSGRAEGQVFEAVCTNVSPGGAFFSCKLPPPVGSFVMMTLKPFGADGPEVRCSLVVAWQAGRGSGQTPGFGGIWQEVSCAEGPAPVRLFAEDVLRLYGMDPQTAEDGSGVLRLADRIVRPSQVMPAQPVTPVAPEPVPAPPAQPVVAAAPTARRSGEPESVPGWNAPSGGAWRPAPSATSIGLSGPANSRGLAQVGRDLSSEGDFSDGERPPPTMPEVPNPGLRRASATWEAAQTAEFESGAARFAPQQREPSGFGKLPDAAIHHDAGAQRVSPESYQEVNAGPYQESDLAADAFGDADDLADEDRGLPLDEDEGDPLDQGSAHQGRRDSEPSQSWDLSTGGTDPDWGEESQEVSSPAAEGLVQADLDLAVAVPEAVASTWTWKQPGAPTVASADTLANTAIADQFVQSAPPVAATGAAVAALTEIATPAHGPTAKELAALPPWSDVSTAAITTTPLDRPHGRPSTDLYGASPVVHQAESVQANQPVQASHSVQAVQAQRGKTGQVAGIRGRDLLQDSDTWLAHRDEVSDAELMALSAPPGPPAEPVAPTQTAASSLERLKSALAAKLGGDAVSGVESLLAEFAAATSSGVGQALPQVARPMAASQRVTAPSDATTAARARSDAAVQSGAPVGDRTEVVDPRHMAQVLAQFGGPSAASGALPRPATPGPMAAIGPGASGRITGPSGTAERITGPGNTSGRISATQTAADSPGRPTRDSNTTHGLRNTQSRPGTPATGTAAPSHLGATARSSSIDLPAGARGAATDPRLQATASDLAAFRANLVDKKPAGLAAEAVAGWRGTGAVIPRASTGADTRENRGGQARPTGTVAVAPMPSPEAVPLLPFGNLLPPKPGQQPANQTANPPASWPGQPSPAQAPTRPTLLPMVAAGVDVGSSGSQRGESTVAYTGQQADQLRDARRQTGALAEHTQHLAGGSNPVMVGRTGPAQVSQLQPVDSQLADWPADVPKGVSQRYDSLQRLGRGGHGVVYKARDRNLDRTVVLKFLASDQLGTEVARKYFLREVKLAASLSHPNILHIYDVAESGGVLYYVMEFIDGVTLSAYLPAGQPLTDYAFLFSVVQQLADALDHAHGAGVLHRDVKPENVLVGQDGIVKLFDFGLARVSHEDLSSEGSLLIGTPFYMAPEQLLGQAVDARADQYALGISLYRMLAGELPFRDGNVYAAHVLEPVPDPRKINARVPASVVPVLERSLAKSPADRYANCKDLALDLWQALFGG